MREYYAHTLPATEPADGWELLSDHLSRVGDGWPDRHAGASSLASAFGAAEWGRLAGLWHDLGKYSDEFQDYLLASAGSKASRKAKRGTVDHATFGARLAIDKGPLGWILGYVIAGHHGGLPNYNELDVRKEKDLPATPDAPDEFLKLDVPLRPPISPAGTDTERSFQVAFFTRMLFSSLVDADFLATESFMSVARSDERRSVVPPSIAELRAALDDHLEQLSARAQPTAVNAARAEVLEACRRHADEKPGLFSLTVPTGGGKTFSSLRFALGHAERNGLRRVIYAIPFTSIIEQNASKFRASLGALGDHGVLEHHTNFDPPGDDTWSRLTSENWAAPLVATTNVQFFESLFANTPSRCRKLHNIAKSVIVLDEAQALPVDLLRPTLAAIQELVRNYGCSVVLCTATQPALERRDGFEIGLPKATEIAPDLTKLFEDLKRVRVEPIRSVDPGELTRELLAHERVLCIANTKREAGALFGALDPEGDAFYLTTNLCAAHRTERLDAIRKRLREGERCRVVSTSLIEAGVDVSFPVVYRAVAGLDSIAQAAGRCNRHGESAELGRVIVYDTGERPPTYIAGAVQDARTVLSRFEDPLLPEAIEAYFRERYWRHAGGWDTTPDGPVMPCFRMQGRKSAPFCFDFRDASDRYRVIRERQTPVVVPWGDEGARLTKTLASLTEPASTALRRRCQRYAVNIRTGRDGSLHDLRAMGVVRENDELAPGLFWFENLDCYDERLGLIPTRGVDPGRLIVST